MSQRTDRRTFLRQAAAAAAGLSLPARALAWQTPAGSLRLAPSDSPRRVLVVGAGLAGLVAAYELGRAGHRVTVLEARQRPGGRVLTLRSFAEGLHADAGAARIPSNHEWTMRYVREFALPLIPFYPPAGLYVRTEGRSRDEVRWKGFAKAVEKRVGVHLGEPSAWFKIAGGNDLLPRAFAERLGESVVYGARVAAVGQDARGVAEETLGADYAVCTIPLAVLGRVEFTPPLSAAKRAAASGMPIDFASRLFFQFRTRFWEGGRTNGFGISDEPAEVWAASHGQPGTRGLMQSYIRHGASVEAMKLPEAERVPAAFARLERLFPGARAEFEAGASKFWGEDEWARCAWTHPTAEQAKATGSPEGRVHFAGEHTSVWASWMQGALESGHRAAREIAEASHAEGEEGAGGRGPGKKDC